MGVGGRGVEGVGGLRGCIHCMYSIGSKLKNKPNILSTELSLNTNIDSAAIQCTQRRGKGSLDAVLDLMSRWISVRPACFVVNKHRFFGCLMNDLFDGTGIWRYDVIIFVRRTIDRSRLSCR